MKMTKTQLKSLIKECLVEILAEGLGGSLNEHIEARGSIEQSRQPKAVIPERRVMRKPSSEAVKMAAAGSSIMESILSETVSIDDRERMAVNDASLKTGFERQVAQSTPEELFGTDAAAKWMTIMDRV